MTLHIDSRSVQLMGQQVRGGVWICLPLRCFSLDVRKKSDVSRTTSAMIEPGSRPIGEQ